jgi:hypothetical protein
MTFQIDSQIIDNGSNNVRPRMKRRNACVFETSRTWNHVQLDDSHYHDVTAHWEGLLTGKLVVLVDGELRCICTRDQQDHDPMDPYGHFSVDGHELEFSPTSAEWSLGQSSMNLSVDGRTTTTTTNGAEGGGSINIDMADAARAVAHQVPAFEEE